MNAGSCKGPHRFAVCVPVACATCCSGPRTCTAQKSVFEWATVHVTCIAPSERRSPAHCIEYAHLIQWDQERPGEAFDADTEEHLRWVFNKAAERAAHYGIQVFIFGGPNIIALHAMLELSCSLNRVTRFRHASHMMT